MDTESWPVSFGDLAVLAILLISAMLAFLRGFVREVLSIGAWVGAAVVAIYTFAGAKPYLRQYVTPEWLADIVTGVGIFVVSLAVLTLISAYLAKGVRGSAMNAVDRSLGFAFGLARGAVVICLAYLLLIWLVPTPDNRPGWVQQARALPWIERGSTMLKSLVPEDMLADGLQQAEETREQVERGAEAIDIINPPRPNADAPGGEPVYNPEAQDQMNQLMNNIAQ